MFDQLKQKVKGFVRSKSVWQNLVLFLVLGAVVAASFFFDAKPTFAGWFGDLAEDTGNTMVTALFMVISSMLTLVVDFLGSFISIWVWLLQKVVVYGKEGEFVSQEQVIIGWRIVRDLINSFFIVVLIAIAISTIIGWKPFNFRQSLPRFIVAAILVNFSRTICLFAINFSTAVMVTLVEPVIEAMPAFVIGLRLPATAALDRSSLGIFSQIDADIDELVVSLLSGIIALVVAIFMLLLALAGISYYVIILVVRIIMLWILTILSPLAFFLWGIPGRGESYWKEWIGEFIKYVIAGPVLGFFLFLNVLFFLNNTESTYGFLDPSQPSSLPAATITIATRPEILIGYIVSIALLFAGLEVSNKLSLRGANFASKVASGYFRGARKLGSLAGRGALTVAGSANDWLYSKGLSFKPIRSVQRLGEGLAAKRAANVRKGDDVWAVRAGKAAKNKAGFRQMAAAFAGGNSEFFKEEGVGGIVKRTALAPPVVGGLLSTAGTGIGMARKKLEGVGPDVGDVVGYIPKQIKRATSAAGATRIGKALGFKQSFESMGDEINRIKAQEAGGKIDKEKFYSNIASKVNRAEFNEGIKHVKDEKRFEELIKKNTALGGSYVSSKLTGTDRTDLEALQDEYGQTGGTFTSTTQFGSANKKDFADNIDKLSKYKENFDNSEAQWNATDDLATYMGAAGSATALDQAENRRGKLSEERAERMSDYQKSVEYARGLRTENRNEYMKKTYKSGRNYGVGQLISNAKGNQHPEDKDDFAGDYLQAAKGGDMPKFMQGFGAKYTIDHDGQKLFVKEVLRGKLGMSEEEAMDLIVEAEDIHKGKSNMAQRGFTKQDDVDGVIKWTTKAEWVKELHEKIAKNPRAILIAGKSAILKRNKDKKNEVSPEALDGLGKVANQLLNVMKKPSDMAQIDEAVFKALGKSGIANIASQMKGKDAKEIANRKADFIRLAEEKGNL